MATNAKESAGDRVSNDTHALNNVPSTNQSTVKARRRQAALTGVARVEFDARTADYKAMLYARKNLSDTADYDEADEEEKKKMLEECMRDAMEKRRQRGQDTMSKVSAYHAGVAGHTATRGGSNTRVPIASFLEENGYVHARGSASSQLADTGVGKNLKRKAEISLAGTPLSTDGPAALSIESSGFSPPPFESRLFGNAIKSEEQDASVYKGPALPPMEKYTNVTTHLANVHHAVTALSRDMASIYKQVKAMREHDVRSIRAEMTLDKTRVNDLTSQMEATNTRVFALENNQVPTMQSQIRKLEEAVTELEKKVGQGGSKEIAKMRAVMATLQTALEKEGGYLD